MASERKPDGLRGGRRATRTLRSATRTLRETVDGVGKGSPPVYGGPGEWGELWVTVGFRRAADLHDHQLNKPTNDCKKAAIQRSAEGAGQVQRVLGGRLPVADSAI